MPGVAFPAHLPQPRRLDFGPEAERGIATVLPPAVGNAYPHFVPAVDPDGNEVSGIRLPDLTVPLATYTGWNLRHPQMGAADQLMSLMGATIPFPATRQERERRGDPRLSIEERYATRPTTWAACGKKLGASSKQGHLLEEDVELLADQAARRYADRLMPG